MIEAIDGQRLAVTDLPSDNRFRVSGGKASAVTPWKGLLCVFVDERVLRDDLKTVERLDGRIVNFAGELASLPSSIQVGVPFERIAEAAEILLPSHQAHLRSSIEVGPPPWGHAHDPDLYRYLLDVAHDF